MNKIIVNVFLETYYPLWVLYVPALFADIPRDCFTSNTIGYYNIGIFRSRRAICFKIFKDFKRLCKNLETNHQIDGIKKA